jgi:hypothetical protein
MERGSCQGAEAAVPVRGVQAGIAQFPGQCRGDRAGHEAAGLDERKCVRGGVEAGLRRCDWVSHEAEKPVKRRQRVR